MLNLKDFLFDKEDTIQEKHKELESKLKDGIEKFLSKNDSKQLDLLIPEIKNIIKDKFQEFDKTYTVYRGMALSRKEFKKIFWSSLSPKQKTLFYKMEDGLQDPVDFETIKDFKLKPKKARFIQSWTSRKDIALSFTSGGEVTILCVAETKSPNLFFGEPGELVKFIDDGFSEEKETISVGAVKCSIYFGPSVANLGIQNKLKSKIFSSK